MSNIHTIMKKKYWLLMLLIPLSASIYSVQSHWGVQGTYYTNANWEGEPHFTSRDRTTSVRLADVHERLASRTFSVKWQGWIVIPATGTYIFATESDDGSYVLIENKRVVDNGGIHGKRKARGEIFLEKGTYRFEVLFFTIGGNAVIDTFWTRPGNDEEPLPATFLFLKTPGWFGFRLRQAVMLLFGTLKIPALMVGILLLLLLPFLLFLKVFRPQLQSLFRSFPKKITFSGGIFIFAVVTIECCSAIFFNVFQHQFTFFDARHYLLTAEEQEDRMQKIERSGEHFLTLGWDSDFATPYGERPRKTIYRQPFIATFGDSFTYCDEVEHDQTWQTHLADLLQKDVYNFGANGYGTDQAYLKYLTVSPDISIPIVILGVTTENINRIVNVYRPFYFPKTSIRATKPRFLLKNNTLVRLDNPIQTPADVQKLDDLQFLHEIGQFDWWYNRDNYPILRFPYSKILFNKRMWLEAIYGKADRNINDMNPRPWEDLWDSEEAGKLMFRILDAFVEQARKRHAIPIIMILPLQYQVRLKFQTQEHETRVLRLLEYCQKNGYAHFEAITALADSVDAEEDIRELYVGHVSPKGNRIIAEALFQYLQQQFPDLIQQAD